MASLSKKTSVSRKNRRTGTYIPTAEEASTQRSWLVVDAADKTLGRVASQVAALIRGKHKASFAPHLDVGDFVIVINASKVRLSGNKLKDKVYRHHTGFVGNVKEISAGDLLTRKPEKLIEFAVRGMLPSGPLGFRLRNKLKVFAGADYPHSAQRPEKYELRG